MLNVFLFNMEDEREGHTDQTMKVLVFHNPTAVDDPVDMSVVMQGIQVLKRRGNKTKVCLLLIGLIYGLNLECPKKLKYTLKYFRNFFLKLDGAKLLQEGLNSLESKLMQ